MKKIIMTMVMLLSLVTIVSAQSAVKFNVDKGRAFNYSTNAWSELEVIGEGNYIAFVEGTYFHIHLPAIDLDRNVRVIANKEITQDSGDKVFIYGVGKPNSYDTNILMYVKVMLRVNGNKEVYLEIPGSSMLGFYVSDVEVLSDKSLL